MKTTLLFISTFVILFLIASCSRDKRIDDTACTMDYRYITITVNGDSLDDYYTIRNSTGEIIRNNQDGFPEDSVYIVLSDNYQPTLKNKTEQFTFKGFINNVEVINEPFVIKADQCHIEYVSGKREVDL